MVSDLLQVWDNSTNVNNAPAPLSKARGLATLKLVGDALMSISIRTYNCAKIVGEWFSLSNEEIQECLDKGNSFCVAGDIDHE